MIKIKKRRQDYDKILLGSDFHFGHNKDFLYEPRGFNNPEDHNNWIQSQVDSISPNSLIVFLGDVGLSIGPQAIQDFLLTFPCETIMILGNHNSGVYQLYQENLPKGFERCQLYPMKITPNVTIVGYEFLLDVDKDYFYCRHMASLIWPDMNKFGRGYGRSHLSGHSHGNLKQANPGEQGFGKILDVGVENAIKYNGTAFFTIDEVVDILDKKESSKFDHH